MAGEINADCIFSERDQFGASAAKEYAMLNKDKIRHSFWGQYLISCLHIAECRIMPKLVDDETLVKNEFRKRLGYDPDLEDPKTFCEKLNWLKLNNRDPLMQTCADKVGVRQYVSDKGYGHLLNELYGVYDKVSQINIDKLPEKFVLKAAHGSHMNVIVDDKSKVNWFRQKLLMSSWLKQDIAWSGREWVYKDIPKRIIAEKYLEDEIGEIRDYKFFCFNGKPEYMEYDIGRFNGTHYRNYYDMQMNFTGISDDCPNNPGIGIPFGEDIFNEMKKIAADLSEPFPFVRVDFYYINGKILFGEMTYFHNGGFKEFAPKEYNLIFSEKWKIKNEKDPVCN